MAYQWVQGRDLREGVKCYWSVLFYYPHMPIGILWIYRLLFVCVCVRRIFGNGYLGRGLA